MDQGFTQLLVETEQNLSTQYEIPWSPIIDKAFKIHKYWKQITSRKLNRIKNTRIITQLEEKIGNDLYMGNPARSYYGQLVCSKKILSKTRREAIENRIKYFSVRQETLVIQGKLDQAKAIEQIAKAEKKQRCYSAIRQLTNPSKSEGLSHVITTVNRKTKRIHSRNNLERVLYDRNKVHFAQAQGTPFTLSPIVDIFGQDGCTQET
jgi:hypothetical protein